MSRRKVVRNIIYINPTIMPKKRIVVSLTCLHLVPVYVVYTFNVLYYLAYALLELILLSTALYLAFFLCCLDLSVAFRFRSLSTRCFAFDNTVLKTSDGATPKVLFHASGPQVGPMLHRRPAPANDSARTTLDPIDLFPSIKLGTDVHPALCKYITDHGRVNGTLVCWNIVYFF